MGPNWALVIFFLSLFFFQPLSLSLPFLDPFPSRPTPSLDPFYLCFPPSPSFLSFCFVFLPFPIISFFPSFSSLFFFFLFLFFFCCFLGPVFFDPFFLPSYSYSFVFSFFLPLMTSFLSHFSPYHLHHFLSP